MLDLIRSYRALRLPAKAGALGKLPGGAGKSRYVARRPSTSLGMSGLVILLLAGCSAQSAIVPGGIISANPCVDAVLAEIAAPGQIAAVSAFSHDPNSASAPLNWARKHPAVGITAEEIIAAKPRLLLTGNLASTGTNAALTKAGIEMVTFGVPATTQESVTQIREIARTIEREAAGETLVGRIENSLRWNGDHRSKVSALIWQAGGFVAGKGTLQDELLARAGFANASETYGLKQWEQLPLEAVIRKPPAVIFMAISAEGDEARTLAMRKRMIARLGDKTRIVPFPDRLLFCGGPTIIDVMAVLKS
jgi:iron complex transport system substrate-binding protein